MSLSDASAAISGLVTISATTVTGSASSVFNVSAEELTLTVKSVNSTGTGGQGHVGVFIGSTGVGQDFIWHPLLVPKSMRTLEHGVGAGLSDLPNDSNTGGPQDHDAFGYREWRQL